MLGLFVMTIEGGKTVKVAGPELVVPELELLLKLSTYWVPPVALQGTCSVIATV
jgi:hypothetical protein